MSHELKTPLANIREGSELLMDGSVGSLDRQQSEVAGILRTNSLKLQRLIENLLTYSTWQSKAATLETSTFDLQGLVRKVMSLHKLPISSRGIQLEVRVSDLLIHADENKLRLIVENLISNAVKFTPDGGNISLHAVANDCELVLDVRDNGPGIAAEDRDRIFEAFYQGQRIQGGPVGGTGIGLSIVLECVQAYKGAVELIDDPNSGAHFRVRLPIQVQAESKSRVANA